MHNILRENDTICSGEDGIIRSTMEQYSEWKVKRQRE